MNTSELSEKLTKLSVLPGKQRLVNMRVFLDKDGEQLRLFKYNKRAFYDQSWIKHPELFYARGIVLDKDNNIVSMPFDKVLNLDESGNTLPDSTVVKGVPKINGFLAVVSLYKGDLLVTSSGSFESPFVDLAKRYLHDPCVLEMCKEYPEYTFMFEIVDPSDPHIVPESPGAYLIGMRETRLYSGLMSEQFLDELFNDYLAGNPNFQRIGLCYHPVMKLGYFRSMVNNPRYIGEGFMIYDTDGVHPRFSAKLKASRYLVVKKLSRSMKYCEQNVFCTPQNPVIGYEGLFVYLKANYSLQEWSELEKEQRVSICQRFLNTLL